MPPRLYDAHNHLQDSRLLCIRDSLDKIFRAEHIICCVVNGAAESDWDDVLALAKAHPQVLPSFGYHPWYVTERSPNWREKLTWYLDQVPSGVGEVGLDRWVEGYDLPAQEEVFTQQLGIAAERNLPVSIHCLKAWGRLYDLLRDSNRPACGFLLHSYGGPQEMVEPLVKLGAYFSFPGYFAHDRKARQRDAFLRVPNHRLLMETDAPDQRLPEHLDQHRLTDSNSGEPLNHPANLEAVYRFAAEMLQVPLEELAGEVEENFRRLFLHSFPMRASDAEGQGTI
jgi:TatD DNase family protein